ncbi:MAG: EAL domain-containing protein [Leptospiraceae bacterium]|nr:EAL domain-containing protein [Leptospiraceae bacterium]
MEFLNFLNKKDSKLENLFEENQVVPFFQPIISLEEKSIFGYESLGRLKTKEGKIFSLGEFFTSGPELLGLQKNSVEFEKLRSDIDRDLRELAFHALAKDKNENSKLFLNISPKTMFWYLKDKKNTTPRSIQLCRELGINPRRIVIEITEDHLDVNLETLGPLVRLYRETGFLIAIDDVGSKSSNLDRIGTFHPDIIKIDMQMFKKSLVNRNYSEIIYNLSKLAQSLGIALLFEGVEKKEELNKALDFGAKFVQGYLFSAAKEELSNKDIFKNELNEYINFFYYTKYDEIINRSEWEKRIEEILKEIPLEEIFQKEGETNNILEIFDIDPSIKRFYVTDKYGNQITPNFIKKNESMALIDPTAKNKNWTWRPYFLNHIYNSYRFPEKWVISQPYMDVTENTLFRTFSKTINESAFIFIDVTYTE